MKKVYINQVGAVCSAGWGIEQIWSQLSRGIPAIVQDDTYGPLCKISEADESQLTALRSEKKFKNTDRAVLLGVAAARQAFAGSGIPARQAGVVMGASRGATHTLEREHDAFLRTGDVMLTTSPETTAGCFSSAIAQDLGCQGPSFFVSSACSTSLNAIGTAYSLIKSGVAEHMLAGGAESSLTSFTLRQFQTLGILAKKPSILFPSKPMHPGRSGMVAGEGAACIAMSSALNTSSVAEVCGFGSSTEQASATGISEAGTGLVQAIGTALMTAGLGPNDIDLIVGHGSSTVKGDAAELAAYQDVFNGQIPTVTLNKWMFGHTLGASGALSVAIAVQHLRHSYVPALPYFSEEMSIGLADDLEISDMKYVLICALGFGGAAAAVIVKKLPPIN